LFSGGGEEVLSFSLTLQAGNAGANKHSSWARAATRDSQVVKAGMPDLCSFVVVDVVVVVVVVIIIIIIIIIIITLTIS
jgi:hypothetical protein